jgi:hypothetical protein
MDGNSSQPEGQEQQPNKGIDQEPKQRHRPANYKKKAPEKQSNHGDDS